MTKRKPTIPWTPSPVGIAKRMLSDDEWRQLKDMAWLRDSARPAIENVLGHYGYYQPAFKGKPLAYHTRRSLEVLGNVTRRLVDACDSHREESELVEDLDKLAKGLGEPGNDVWKALADAAPVLRDLPLKRAQEYMEMQLGRVAEMRTWLLAKDRDAQAGQVKAWLAEIEEWLVVACNCVPPSPKGEDNEDAYLLVRHLHDILLVNSSKHPDGLSSSTNKDSPVEFVGAVFEIIDMNVGPGTRIAAIKKVAAEKSNVAKGSEPFQPRLPLT